MKKLNLNIKGPFKCFEVKPNIYLLEFKDHYDMAMHFLRFQEYYESPNPKFRGKPFEIFDFMEWYSKNHNGVFTYPMDWGGFNIPGDVIDKCLHDCMMENIKRNKYDGKMYQVWNRLAFLSRPDNWPEDDYKFYLLGAVAKDRDTLSHEIAHGLFYTTPSYKKEMTALVKALPVKLRNKIYKRLEKLGYTKEVFVDECQAYMATGLMRPYVGMHKKERQPFIKLFKKYNEKKK